MPQQRPRLGWFRWSGQQLPLGVHQNLCCLTEPEHVVHLTPIGRLGIQDAYQSYWARLGPQAGMPLNTVLHRCRAPLRLGLQHRCAVQRCCCRCCCCCCRYCRCRTNTVQTMPADSSSAENRGRPLSHRPLPPCQPHAGALPANAQACPVHCNCEGVVPVCLGEFARNPPKNVSLPALLQWTCGPEMPCPPCKSVPPRHQSCRRTHSLALGCQRSVIAGSERGP